MKLLRIFFSGWRTNSSLLICWLLVAITALIAFFLGSWYSGYVSVRVPFSKVESLTTLSQWFIPLSPWVVSDEILYMYSGVRLLEGAMPWQTSPEVPPLAKLSIGVSQKIFSNPYVINWVFLFASCWLFLLIVHIISPNPIIRLLSPILILASPVFITQFSQALLEPQLGFFFLAFLYFFLLAQRSQKATPIILAGISLGWMAACKFPFFAGVYAVCACLLFWLSSKKHALFFALATVVGYFSAYLPFFLQGYSLLNWMQGQWWMIQFYRLGGASASSLEMLSFLLIGSSVDELRIGSLREWTPLWIVQFCLLVWLLRNKVYAQLAPETRVMLLFLVVTLGLHALSPFVLRYFYHTQFLFILLSLAALREHEVARKSIKGACLLLLITAVAGFLRFVYFGPRDVAVSFAERYNSSNYSEMDVHLELRPWEYLPERTAELHRFDEESQIVQRSLRFTKTPPTFSLASEWTGQAIVSLKLLQGNTLSYELPLVMQRSGVQWKVRWSDNLFFPGYRPGCSVHAIEEKRACFSPWQSWLRLERSSYRPAVEDSYRLSGLIQQPPLAMFHDFLLRRGNQKDILWPVMQPNVLAPSTPGLSIIQLSEDELLPQFRPNAISRTLTCPSRDESYQ